ncbi:MAG: GIY-YIG nuclease family protein [Gaiellales bacterium]|nr:GIY-YIG nuclease family protein [Gaiellales bacterium]
MQLQLSLTLANDLYDLLALSGEPVDFLSAARTLLAAKEEQAPSGICYQIMDALVQQDARFCWQSPQAIGLLDWEAIDPDLASVSFVVVDVETTGSRPGPAKITEIGAVRIEGLQQVSSFHSLINPQRPIPPKIVELTGITQDMVCRAPRIDQVLPALMDFMRGAVFVGHNAHFDLAFLNYELGRLNGHRLGDGAIDTLRLSRLLAPGVPNHRLATLAVALGSPVSNFHRALEDASATAHVFLTLLGRLQERGITNLNQARSYIDPAHKRDRHKLALTRDIPRVPGTYLFKDEAGQILYVGKANRLRDRVRSYFIASPDHSRKIRQALRRLQRIDWEETGSPLKAVVREQELILEHRPPCNVLGQRPEKYLYLKASPRGHGLRLYTSPRRAAPRGSVVLGPFRSPGRLRAAIDLLQRCYPIRRCTGLRGVLCTFGQTKHCLAPCTGKSDAVRTHDALLLCLLRWLAGEPWDLLDPPPAFTADPERAAIALRGRLSQQGRFEEAGDVQRALEHLQATRRACSALHEALGLNLAVVWADTGAGEDGVHVDLVWEGRLCSSISMTSSTAPLELGVALRALADPAPPSFPVAVDQLEVDAMLAVRRWLLENPEAAVVRLSLESDPTTSPGGSQSGLEGWRQQLLKAVGLASPTCPGEG